MRINIGREGYLFKQAHNILWKAWKWGSGIQNIVHVLLKEGGHKRGLDLNQLKRFDIYGKRRALCQLPIRIL